MRAPEFWNHKHGPMAAPLARSLLSPLSALVTLAGRWRQNRAKPVTAAVPVICVGNVTMGGTGKTPLAIALAEILIKRAHTPVFLTRGYGGALRGPVHVDETIHSARDVGDEALLLARIAPTIVARDRVAGATLAANHKASIIIMDDGFQNPALAKDISLLVMDQDVGLGNGRVFPAGPLREPLDDAVKRANAVILMGDDAPQWQGALPSLHAGLVNPDALPKGPLLAFAGIGRPQKFFDAIRACGGMMVQEIGFDDHHVYSDNDIARLHDWAKKEGAQLITTQKDLVRLPPALRDGLYGWPVKAEFADTDALITLLKPVLGS